MSNRTSRPIIGMEDDDFQSDDESVSNEVEYWNRAPNRKGELG